MWKTWKSWFWLVGASFPGEETCAPTGVFCHDKPVVSPHAPGGMGDGWPVQPPELCLPVADLLKRGPLQEIAAGLPYKAAIYYLFAIRQGFSCIWIQKPFAPFRLISQRGESRAKTVFHGFHSMWKNPVLKMKPFGAEVFGEPVHIPATAYPLFWGSGRAIRPLRSACVPGLPWHGWPRPRRRHRRRAPHLRFRAGPC